MAAWDDTSGAVRCAFSDLRRRDVLEHTARLKNIPIRAYHGALDRVVLVTESINMVNSVNRNGGNAVLTIYPEAAHNAWEPTYSDPAYWEWMMAQVKMDQ